MCGFWRKNGWSRSGSSPDEAEPEQVVAKIRGGTHHRLVVLVVADLVERHGKRPGFHTEALGLFVVEG